jgi:hypothetical protein
MNSYTRTRIILSKRLAKRDGLHCHYCGAALVPSFIFNRIQSGTFPNKQKYRDAANALSDGAVMATLDHMIPESLGGRLTLENAVLACELCNKQKGSLPYSEFVQMQQMRHVTFVAC